MLTPETIQKLIASKNYRFSQHAEAEREADRITMVKLMECYFCGGKIEKKKVDHVHQWGGKIYLFKGVSAEVCTQCGETYFDSVELKKMDQLVTSTRKPKNTLSIPVFAL